MELLTKYKNGNYTVKLYDDGTKIKYNNLNNLTPSFPDSIDLTITTKCNGGCSYCYLGCTENGTHANLHHKILDTLHSGMELAINANDLTHPELENFLFNMKNKGVIVNITINQQHYIKNLDKLKSWQDNGLLYGIGISLVDSFDKDFIDNINTLKNTVVHVIDGCVTKSDLDNLSDKNIKLLVLGYKIKGRGEQYYNINTQEIEDNIMFLRNHLDEYKSKFNGIGYDNVANEHLNIKEKVGPEKWEKYHIGEEGEFTYFIDLVNEKFAVSSQETEMFDLLDSIDDMFYYIRKRQGFEK